MFKAHSNGTVGIASGHGQRSDGVRPLDAISLLGPRKRSDGFMLGLPPLHHLEAALPCPQQKPRSLVTNYGAFPSIVPTNFWHFIGASSSTVSRFLPRAKTSRHSGCSHSKRSRGPAGVSIATPPEEIKGNAFVTFVCFLAALNSSNQVTPY